MCVCVCACTKISPPPIIYSGELQVRTSNIFRHHSSFFFRKPHTDICRALIVVYDNIYQIFIYSTIKKLQKNLSKEVVKVHRGRKFVKYLPGTLHDNSTYFRAIGYQIIILNKGSQKILPNEAGKALISSCTPG